MGGLSIWHWLLLAVVVMLLFGKGRLSDIMGDAGRGIKSFKKGLADEEEEATARRAAAPPPRLDSQPPLEPSKDPHLQPMQDDRPKV
ncbi:sec-independent protein translocase protein TatA [Sphingomonas vulcanisoli]|uniref:Sec-independent protein translocase protein TatA n=1 Tax=Sphingomonas vulcanisoli TaxID=1658060 RepID=A0ABX0TQV5_9SPHN|nr:twin-arginine translocase TatA/TatE family subunit [Sphingomonas vulcanisoli]NIJ07913.1 sec-independent protein translocase protein TatA [Sphingomonas vulcanisoli]